MSLTPDAPYTVALCKQALRVTEVLAGGSNTVAKRQFWERIERTWRQRLAEAEERENVSA